MILVFYGVHHLIGIPRNNNKIFISSPKCAHESSVKFRMCKQIMNERNECRRIVLLFNFWLISFSFFNYIFWLRQEQKLHTPNTRSIGNWIRRYWWRACELARFRFSVNRFLSAPVHIAVCSRRFYRKIWPTQFVNYDNDKRPKHILQSNVWRWLCLNSFSRPNICQLMKFVRISAANVYRNVLNSPCLLPFVRHLTIRFQFINSIFRLFILVRLILSIFLKHFE